jgi:hypothetical protein
MPNRTDQVVSKAMEAEKALKATVKGLTGVFKTLMEQHGAISALLRRADGGDVEPAELWPEIRSELLSHERGESRVVYAALRELDDTRALAEQHDEEAAALELQIARVDAQDVEAEIWGDRFEELAELVKQHMADEESDIFPAAQKALGKDRARQLDARFLEAKKAAMEVH